MEHEPVLLRWQKDSKHAAQHWSLEPRHRATFEQGILSVLPMLEGPCTATSLPGEHLFQASALPHNRMRPATFHAFGETKVGAQDALRDLRDRAGKRCRSRHAQSTSSMGCGHLEASGFFLHR